MKPIIPVFSKDLIEQLDKEIPRRCPALSMTDREIWFYAGKRALIDALLSDLKREETKHVPSELVL